MTFRSGTRDRVGMVTVWDSCRYDDLRERRCACAEGNEGAVLGPEQRREQRCLRLMATKGNGATGTVRHRARPSQRLAERAMVVHAAGCSALRLGLDLLGSIRSTHVHLGVRQKPSRYHAEMKDGCRNANGANQTTIVTVERHGSTLIATERHSKFLNVDSRSDSLIVGVPS